MHRCPPEILWKIYGFACTDDGYTGRSLSLVSRYIHESSKPVKFQSLAVRGAWQAVECAALLESTPSHLRRVDNLFISDARPYDHFTSHAEDTEWDMPLTFPRDLAGTYLEGVDLQSFVVAVKYFVFFMPNRRRRRAVEARRIKVLDAAMDGNSAGVSTVNLMHDASLRILSIIAPTLRILSSAIRYPVISVHRPVTPPLPALVELSLSYTSWSQDSPSATMVSSLPVFPSLLRFDLAGVHGAEFDIYYSHHPHRAPYPVELLQQVQRLAPSLTHIFLPIIPKTWAHLTIKDFKIVFAAGSDKVPAGLTKVFIQLDCFSRASHSGDREDFESLAASDHRIIFKERKVDTPIFSLAETTNRMDHIGLFKIEQEKDWLERIDGGDGCWNMDGTVDADV